MKFELFVWNANWLGSVIEINIELAISLFQWFSYAAKLGPYFKFFEGSAYGNKPNRFAIPELESNRVFIFLCWSFRWL